MIDWNEYQANAEGIKRDLAEIGYDITDEVGVLSQKNVGDRSILPVLLKWLPIVQYRPLKWDIIRSLGQPWAKPDAARPLVDEFRKIDPKSDDGVETLRGAICGSLASVADDSVLDDMIDLVLDDRHGEQCALLAEKLGKFRQHKDRVLPVLIELAARNEPAIANHAMIGLGWLGAPEGRPIVERFLNHKDPWVRNKAKQAIKKLPTPI